MNPKIDATVINDRGGVLELAMVVGGKMIVFDLDRHVASALACRVTETLAKPYFVEASSYSMPARVICKVRG